MSGEKFLNRTKGKAAGKKAGMRVELARTAALALAVVAAGVWSCVSRPGEAKPVPSTDIQAAPPGFAAEPADTDHDDAPTSPDEPSQT